ncbi:serine/threonine-protein kinase PknD [Novipirellula caenicola]|uniref:Serine/threonine-protein kinase PknD n=2 Tax=Novipirellula caenicola TaxID=1536901 RepID=A0ABP9VP56_9BACT
MTPSSHHWISQGPDGALYRHGDPATAGPPHRRFVLNGPAITPARLDAIANNVRFIDLLQSPYVCRVIENGLSRTPPILVAESLPALRLATASQDLSLAEVLTIATQLTSLVLQTHHLGLYHPHFTAENIALQRPSESWQIRLDYLDLAIDARPSQPTDAAANDPLDADRAGLYSVLRCLLSNAAKREDSSKVASADLHAQAIAILKWLENESASEPEPLLRLLQRADSYRYATVATSADLGNSLPLQPREPAAGNPETQITRESKSTRGNDAATAELNPETDGGSIRESSFTSATPALQRGDRLGRFLIGEKIGQGGMGAVFAGTDLLDQSAVAIKVLKTNRDDSAQAIRRFRKEARVLADIQNEFVTRLIHVDQERGIHYLAMEYIDGIDLKKWMTRRIRGERIEISEHDALCIVGDIARALACAHSQGIVHRDIKPENVLLQRRESDLSDDDNDIQNYRVKLSDFGIARHIDQSESMEVTGDGVMIGTPLYMSPEQCRGSHELGPPTDVYSLGITLFELLTGQVPFQSDDRIKLATMHLYDRPPSVQQFNPKLSDACASIVNRALAKEPEKRFVDASQFSREIDRVLRGTPSDIETHPKMPEHCADKRWQKTEHWELISDPDELWPYVSNTERLNRAIGLPAVTYRTEYDEQRGIRKFGSFRISGVQVAWEEHPFEWIEANRMGILREFQSGPFVWFMSIVTMEPIAGGGTKLSHEIRVQPRNLLGRVMTTVEADWKAFRNLNRVYLRIDKSIQSRKQGPKIDPFESPHSISTADAERLQKRLDRLIDSGIDADLANAIGVYLSEAPPQTLAQIRPISLARELGFAADDTVDACLVAASVGLLSLRWDVLCPTCRAPAATHPNLSAIQDHTHCEACHVAFQSNRGDAIEMVFRAHPEIRRVDDQSYCIGGPEHSPHVVAQIRIEAEEMFELELHLTEGDYLLRGTRLPQTQSIRIEQGRGASEYTTKLLSLGQSSHIPKLRSGIQRIQLINDDTSLHVIRIERTIPRDDVVTAASASTNQRFRNLFPDQVFADDNPITAEQMTLLATTIQDIEPLYASLGDAEVYKRVHEIHRRIEQIVQLHHGTIAKTVGESMLAAFDRCDHAIAAALEVQQSEQNREQSIGIGVHAGRTLVAVANDRLDYFGSTARAAMAMPSIAGEDLLLSETVYADPRVMREFTAMLSHATYESVSLPGLPHQPLARIRGNDKGMDPVKPKR